MNYKLGDLVELVTETNSELIYGLDDIVGVTLEKQMIPTIANLTQTDLDDFIIVHPKDFVYNPRTHGKKIGLGFNTTNRCFISTWNNNTFCVKPEMASVILPEYLYMHFLRERWDKEACFNAWGSSTVVLLWSSFCDMRINVPSIEEQRKIVHDYKVINDRIEILRKINENLEAQIISIYNNLINCSEIKLTETTLGNICGFISRGITPNYNDDSNEIVLNQKCIRGHLVDFSFARRHIPKAISDKWVQFGDLLVNSTGAGTLGRTALALFRDNNVTVDSHISIVRPQNHNLIYYVGTWGMTHEIDIENIQEGSTGQTELPRERLINMPIVIPTEESISEFNNMVAPLFELRMYYQKEVAVLLSTSVELANSVGIMQGA